MKTGLRWFDRRRGCYQQNPATKYLARLAEKINVQLGYS